MKPSTLSLTRSASELAPAFGVRRHESPLSTARQRRLGPAHSTRFATLVLALLLLSTLLYRPSTAHAQGTAFTYQGFLTVQGAPANGAQDFEFKLFDDPAAGTQQGSTLTLGDVGVTNGLFTVTLNFGTSVFDGSARWLDIAMRPGASMGSFTNLSPRQPVTATPYAMRAANAGSALSVSGSVAAAQITGTIASNNIAAGSISSVMLATGAVGSSQLASGAVTTSALADGAVTGLKVASVPFRSLLSTTFTNPTPFLNDRFGESVAFVGNDRVLIGAFRDDTGATNAGAAYLFSTEGTLLTTFTNPTPADGDRFGISVAAVGSDRVLIGALYDDAGVTNAGAAYLFTTTGTLLTTFTNPTPANNDEFGISVAALGTDRVLVGAARDDTPAVFAGAAHLFTLEYYMPGLVAEGVRARSITTTSMEDGAVTAAKIGGVLLPSQIPDLDAVKIVSGTLNTNRIPNLDTAKIISGTLDANRIPGLDAAKIVSGTLNNSRIPNLDAAKITSGTLLDERLSTNVALLSRSSQIFTGSNVFTGTFLGSPPYLKYWEVQPKGTDGGANVAGTNNFRNFTEISDTHALGSTNVNGDIVLPAGTYQCRISAPGYRVNSHQIRLRTTTGTVLLYGTTEYSDNALSPGVQSRSLLEGQFVLGSTTTNQVQHYMEVVRSPNGLGVAGGATWTESSAVEVYAVAEFWKIQ